MNDTNKLDDFRPTMEMMSSFRRILLDAGFPFERIDQQLLEASAAAVAKWYLSTTEGQVHFLAQFGLDWSRGEADKRYEVIDDRAGKVTDIKHDQVILFHGASVAGKPIPLSQLQIS